jgi:hypothetical protein
MAHNPHPEATPAIYPANRSETPGARPVQVDRSLGRVRFKFADGSYRPPSGFRISKVSVDGKVYVRPE